MTKKTRTVHDTMGELEVPIDALWERRLSAACKFSDRFGAMPAELIRALLEIKWATALSHAAMGRMESNKATTIAKVCRDLIASVKAGDLTHFPLVVWQTGSGTQTNMNVNEVVAECSNRLCPDLVFHPNDDINMGQSSNDVFPAAMHIAAKRILVERVLPAVDELIAGFDDLATRCRGQIKIGRTHMRTRYWCRSGDFRLERTTASSP